MSVPNKSLDKNKRYAGVKANDFVNKTRVNEVNRPNARPQGWANLGKINSRRVPPPANVPSLKSETGVNIPTFDPTVTTNHGWTSNDNALSINSPTQQQLDSLPMNSSTPPSSAEIDKPRVPSTWSAITAGSNVNSNEPTPNLLALNDFPRLATNQDRKSQSESIANTQNPTFRPANLATWKDGGGNRAQPLPNDIPQMIPTNPGANLYQQQNMRMYPPEMWNYNPYTPMALPMHQQHHQQQQQRRVNSLNDYKTPTILRNKDIDDLSKITDNTWANAPQEVNYEEKIRFSDDEDTMDSNNRSHRMNNPVSKHTRLIHDDQHLKQMQENKNSELINTLTIAKQRRDEQERHLRSEQLMGNIDEQKPIPGYQTRPLLTSNEQENYHGSPLWHSNKDTPRTPNSQSSFTMRSWSDQMDSFNYSSLHETSAGGHVENDDPSLTNQYSRSQSESSSQSQTLSKKSRRPPLLSKKPVKSNFTPAKQSPQVDQTDYYDNSNDQWENWNESSENRPRQQLHSDDLSTAKSTRYNKQPSIKTRPYDRSQVNSRSKPIKINQPVDNKPTNHKNQPPRRLLSPTRPPKSIDSTPQESISYKPQQQRSNLTDHKQRYQTSNINTASIPPLMSVRSDATSTAKLFQNTPSDYYEDENAYYDSSLQTHQRYHQSNLHNRGYTTLGSYGRYRRSGTLRHQQQFPTYNLNNTSAISSAPTTSTGTRPKKNLNNKKPNPSSEQTKPANVDEVHSPIVKNVPTIEETKPLETPVLSPTIEIEKSNGTSEHKSAIKPDNIPALIPSAENDSTKTNQKHPTTSANSKQRTNKNQQDQRYQNQQAPRHRNNYPRATQDYESMQVAATHNYYGANRRTAHGGRMQDLSSGYYYDPSQAHYNNRYNYSTGHYPQQQQQRPNNKTTKRGGGGGGSSANPPPRQQKPTIINGSNNNNNNNFRHHSTSDNDQKEGEEWETASESSTNMRNGHEDTNPTINTTKSIHRGRTPPKKSFSSQRPNARQFFKYTNA